jgi:processive 1,2-diacylglycerol beta-glucosyltransferase
MADLLITRANGHTVAEACAAGIPLVLLRPAPGLEERTADWFVERGVALKAHDANDLEWVLSDLLCNNGRQLKSMGEAARNGAAGRRGSAGLSAERMARRI